MSDSLSVQRRVKSRQVGGEIVNGKGTTQSASGSSGSSRSSRPNASTAAAPRPTTSSSSASTSTAPPSTSVPSLSTEELFQSVDALLSESNGALPLSLDPSALTASFTSDQVALEELSHRMSTHFMETRKQLQGFREKVQEIKRQAKEAVEKRGLVSDIRVESGPSEIQDPLESSPRARSPSSTSATHPVAHPPSFPPPSAPAPRSSVRTPSRPSTSAGVGGEGRPRLVERTPSGSGMPASSPPASPSSASTTSFPRVAGSLPISLPLSSTALVAAAASASSSSRPQTARPSSSHGRGMSTPRKRLEQAKLFSHSVYGEGESRGGAGGGVGDEVDESALPASLSKPRATSAPYRPQHAKPSFVPPAHPLPPIEATDSQAQQQTQQGEGDKGETKQATTDSLSPASSSRSTSSSHSSRPVSKPLVKKKATSSSAASTTASSGGLFASPFVDMKPLPTTVANKTKQKVLTQAKLINNTAENDIVEQAAAAVAAGEEGQQTAATAARLVSVASTSGREKSAAPRPSTSTTTAAAASAQPVSTGPSFSVQGSAFTQSAAPAASASRPSTKPPTAASSSSPDPPAASPSVRQQLIAAKRAAAALQEPEEVLLNGDDDEDAGVGGESLEQIAARIRNEEDDAEDAEEDLMVGTNASLFTRPWSAHSRVTQRPLHSARGPAAQAVDEGYEREINRFAAAPALAVAPPAAAAERTYSSFSIPISQQSALQRQLAQQQQATPLASTYARAFAPSQQKKQLQSGGMTPRGTLPVAHNPFLLQRPS